MAPREGHFKAMTRVFGYARQRPRGRILIDTSQPKVRENIGEPKEYDWMEFYPDAVECVTPDRPESALTRVFGYLINIPKGKI